MAISYPLTLPTSQGIARIEFQTVNSVGISTSPFSFQSQRQFFGGGYWTAQVSLPPMIRADAEAWITFITKLKGPFGTFLMGDPFGKSPRGTAPGTPLVMGASQTGGTLTTDGWGLSQTGVLLEGDYIQLGNRLYKVLEDVDSDGVGTGEATFDIWPNLRESPADNTSIITNNTVGTFRLASTNNPFSSLTGHEDAPIYGVSFSAVENI